MQKTIKHRLFLAVPIPAKATHDLQQLLSVLHLPQGRWITADNAHLTVRFLGDVPVDLTDHFWLAVVSQIKDKLRSFDCKVTTISHFPDAKPHVLAAIVENNPALMQLFDQVNAIAAGFDFQVKTTPFKPHITLYRCRNRCQPIQSIALDNLILPVNELVLYRSEPSSVGSVYTSLNSAPLRWRSGSESS